MFYFILHQNYLDQTYTDLEALRAEAAKQAGLNPRNKWLIVELKEVVQATPLPVETLQVSVTDDEDKIKLLIKQEAKRNSSYEISEWDD